MKRRGIMYVFLCVALVVFTLSSCRKIVEDQLQTRCEDAVDDMSVALETYSTNMNSATCEDYKETIRNYTDDCKGYAYYQTIWEDYYNSIDCTVYDQ